MRIKKSELLLLNIVGAFLLFVFINIAIGYVDCKDSGGSYVRGLFWFECVGGKDD